MARHIPLSANRGRSGGRGGQRRNGWSCKWSDELKLRDGESAWFQLTPGSYPVHDAPEATAPFLGLPMFKLQYTNPRGYTSYGYFRESEEGGTLSARAEAEDPNVNEPKYGDVNRYFVGVMHYALYQQVPVEKNGQPLLYSHGKMKGKQVYNWSPVLSIRDRKKILASGDMEGIGLYRKKFLEMPSSHFKVVQEINRRARSMCRCGGALFPSLFVCSGCEEPLLETEDSDLTDGEIAAYGDSEIRCRHCGAVEFPRAEYDCDTCDDPRPHKYHQVAAQVSRTKGSDGYPSYSLTAVISMADLVLADGTTRAVTGVAPDTEEFQYPEELEKLITNQFDFEAYTAPKSDEEYSNMLGLRQGEIGYAASAKSYGNNFRR